MSGILYIKYNIKKRSANQIQNEIDEGIYTESKTIWLVRSSPFKLRNKLDDAQWEQKILKWKKWGLLGNTMKKYLAKFFPGKESEALSIGLITDEDYDNSNESKDNQADLDLI